MVLITDNMSIDIDQVSFLHEQNRMVVVGGQGVHLNEDEDFNAVKKAFNWANQTCAYDKDLRKLNR